MKEQRIHESARLEKNLYMATACSFDPPDPGGLWRHCHNAECKHAGIARCFNSCVARCVTIRITSRVTCRFAGCVSG
jgi:hypothetical protein